MPSFRKMARLCIVCVMLFELVLRQRVAVGGVHTGCVSGRKWRRDYGALDGLGGRRTDKFMDISARHAPQRRSGAELF